jgi:hypothetical protein
MAPGTTGNDTVTATCGAIQGSTSINVVTNNNFLGLLDPVLANLTQSLFVDMSIDRQDMISILHSVSANGPVSYNDFADLKTILVRSATLNMPGYVKVLANDVINGSFANAHFQGQNLGNLTALSSTAKLNNLIDKWFYGADHPAIDANVPAGQTFTYLSATGSLFNVSGTPSITDEFQGMLGDCYFITALGTVADSSPAAIQNMFLDNGDNTWTVRFYSNGVADYVTVDGMLPTDSTGMLVYADFGSMYNNTANTLWIPLAEKAYAQWNETTKEGRDGRNQFSSIEGGNPAPVYAQLLGHAANSYIISVEPKQTLIDAVNNNMAVAICTNATIISPDLYASHAYGVIGYDSFSDTFTLYNPWGTNQPSGGLTWAQLQTDCWGFQVADPAGSILISAIPSLGASPRVRAMIPTFTMNTPQTPHTFAADRKLVLNSGQEPDFTSNKVLQLRDGLFASHSTEGFNIPAINTEWMAIVQTRQSSTKSRDLHFLAADEFFRETMSLEFIANSPAPLLERIC